nr:hypothetical protein [uncultured bacterium]
MLRIYLRGKAVLVKTPRWIFRGRSRILSKNYRNTKQVLELAWEFYKSFQETKVSKSVSEDVEIIPPQSSLRSGNIPVVKKFNSFVEESKWVCSKIRELLQNGSSMKDIAVLYRVKQDRKVKYVEKLLSDMKELGLLSYWLTKDQNSKKDFKSKEDKILISTIASAKRVEF